MLLDVIDTLSARTGGRPAPTPGPSRRARFRVRQELGPALPAARQDRCSAAVTRSLPCCGRLRPAAPDLPLTRREREIADLIAAGLTNRQIAARLFIAERTVDTHVGHVLAKLGCANWAHVATIVLPPQRWPRPASLAIRAARPWSSRIGRQASKRPIMKNVPRVRPGTHQPPMRSPASATAVPVCWQTRSCAPADGAGRGGDLTMAA